jgi:hypothetical protein
MRTRSVEPRVPEMEYPAFLRRSTNGENSEQTIWRMGEHARGQFDFPPMFAAKHVLLEGATIYVRFGRQGSAVVLPHGYGETGNMWAPFGV